MDTPVWIPNANDALVEAGLGRHPEDKVSAPEYQLRRIHKLQSQLAELESLRLTFLPLFDQTLGPLQRRLNVARATLGQWLQHRLQQRGLTPQQRETGARWLAYLCPVPNDPVQEAMNPPNRDPGTDAQDPALSSVRRNRDAKRQERQRRGVGNQSALQLQNMGDALLRSLYRQLASALHPDREPDLDKRPQKTAWMSQANTAYACGDWLTLVQLKAYTNASRGFAPGPVAESEIAALTLLLKRHVAQLERRRAQEQQALVQALGVPKGLGVTVMALHHWLKQRHDQLSLECAEMEQRAYDWRDDYQFKASLNAYCTRQLMCR